VRLIVLPAGVVDWSPDLRERGVPVKTVRSAASPRPDTTESGPDRGLARRPDFADFVLLGSATLIGAGFLTLLALWFFA
jgi:hypothetical protein